MRVTGRVRASSDSSGAAPPTLRLETTVKPPATHITILLVLFALAAMFAAAISASSLTGGSRLTATPPAYYAGSDRADTLTGTGANDVLLGAPATTSSTVGAGTTSCRAASATTA